MLFLRYIGILRASPSRVKPRGAAFAAGRAKDQFPAARAAVVRNEIGAKAVRRGVVAVYANRGIEIRVDRRRVAGAINRVLGEQAPKGVEIPPIQ
jgi:hypothetical protein